MINYQAKNYLQKNKEDYKYLLDTCLNSFEHGMIDENKNSAFKNEDRKNQREMVSYSKDDKTEKGDC